jgi:hypothetical protein
MTGVTSGSGVISAATSDVFLCKAESEEMLVIDFT